MACPGELGADAWLTTVHASTACVRQVVAKLRSAVVERMVPSISWIQNVRECLMEVTWGLEEGPPLYLDATTRCPRLEDLMRRYYEELEEGQALCSMLEDRGYDNDDLAHIAANHNINDNNDSNNESNNNNDDNKDSGECNSVIDSLEDGDDVLIEVFSSNGDNNENSSNDDNNNNNNIDDNNNNNNNSINNSADNCDFREVNDVISIQIIQIVAGNGRGVQRAPPASSGKLSGKGTVLCIVMRIRRCLCG
ncbi:hypothetical protein CBR_g20438 [Chara braunii]|uniref:Uncharacterized protein n=1 Tax=Chara braunii TaxID=69332 RepID=A0A388JUG2_CHABU|nr:hypothetical protein CBR_g20438 [Chara braunii]|eukprot:GBG61407.1 hypothetical protein CBR_g20438 [Chara braunii]